MYYAFFCERKRIYIATSEHSTNPFTTHTNPGEKTPAKNEKQLQTLEDAARTDAMNPP
jgi:hypothetical protein